jgi:hypothetical protein
MRGAVQQGYAAVGTDMGHFSEADVDASWALNAPEKDPRLWLARQSRRRRGRETGARGLLR